MKNKLMEEYYKLVDMYKAAVKVNHWNDAHLYAGKAMGIQHTMRLTLMLTPSEDKEMSEAMSKAMDIAAGIK